MSLDDIITQTAYIGLGSNLSGDIGSSAEILAWSVAQLRKIGAVRCSSLYVSAPVGPQDQPDFYNAVVALKTTLSPLNLLHQLQHLEQEAGRVKLRHWGERTLDLDLLLMPPYHSDTAELRLPHPEIVNRSFVLQPLLELAPDMMLDEVLLKQLPLAQTTDGIFVQQQGDVWAYQSR